MNKRMTSYTIYDEQDPKTIGISIEPTPNLTLSELNQLIEELTKIRIEMEYGTRD